jgi:hypothetical protein
MLPAESFDPSHTSGKFSTSTGEAKYYDVNEKRHQILYKSSYQIKRSYETGQRYFTGVLIHVNTRHYIDLYDTHKCNTDRHLYITIGNNVKITYNAVPITLEAFENYSDGNGYTNMIFTVVFRRVDIPPGQRHLISLTKEIHIVTSEPTPQIPALLPPRPAITTVPLPVQSESHHLKYFRISEFLLESLKQECKKCSICIEDVNVDGCLIKKCNHLFHKACIDKWFETKGSTLTCPNCGE